MRIRQEKPAFILYEGAYEGILFSNIEVKVGSEKYLAKYTAVVWGNDTYF